MPIFPGTDEAIDCYDHFLKIHPGNADALNNKGVACAALKKYEEVILYFDEVLKIHPGNEFACFIKGITLAALKMFDEVTTSYERDYSV